MDRTTVVLKVGKGARVDGITVELKVGQGIPDDGIIVMMEAVAEDAELVVEFRPVVKAGGMELAVMRSVSVILGNAEASMYKPKVLLVGSRGGPRYSVIVVTTVDVPWVTVITEVIDSTKTAVTL